MFSSRADRLARIRALEVQRSVLAAEQAREVALLAAECRVEIEVEIATVPKPGVGSRRRREHAERHLVADVAKARRISPWQAGQWVDWAQTAPVDTPATWALFAAGELSEKRAVTVAREVAPLEPDDRRLVDAGIAANCAGWGDKKIADQTRTAVYTLDPAGACARAAHAANERRVTTRPAPETMGWLTLLAPMAQAVACRAALEQAVREAKAVGDPRGRGQIMADTLVERVTGQLAAAEVPVSIQLIVTDRTLLGASDAPARLADGSPVPAPLARAMMLDTDAAHRVRRLFCDPVGRLITAETDSRHFTKAMADFIALRDQTCTTEYCDAPIRHTDHVHPHTHGGPTSLTNGRGTCVWCNETKSDRIPDRPEVPTGPPGRRRPRRHRRSPVERRARRQIMAAKRQRPPAVVDVRLKP